jgi:hypothetical protein
LKQILLLIVCLLSFSATVLAQAAETFDIATFQSPKGWEKLPSEDSVQFSTQDKQRGAYCVITLFRSLPSHRNSKENFDAAWQSLVREAVNVSAAPQMQPSNNPEDWKVEMGSAPFEKEGLKGVAVARDRQRVRQNDECHDPHKYPGLRTANNGVSRVVQLQEIGSDLG